MHRTFLEKKCEENDTEQIKGHMLGNGKVQAGDSSGEVCGGTGGAASWEF